MNCLLLISQNAFSRMLRRRVPVLRLGSRGPRGDARSLRLCPPSVRKRSQAFASVGKCRASSGVANRRETQNCRHFLRLAFQKCQQSQGSGGSWSRNAELSSLLDSSRVFASQKWQQSQGSGVVVAKRRPVVTFGLVSGLRVSKVSAVTGIGGVVVAKRRPVVTFGLVSRLRLSKVSSHRDGEGRGREAQTCRHFWPCLWRGERREEK